MRAIGAKELSRCSLIGRKGREGVCTCVCVHVCVCVCVEWKSDVTGMFTKALWMNAQ